MFRLRLVRTTAEHPLRGLVRVALVIEDLKDLNSWKLIEESGKQLVTR